MTSTRHKTKDKGDLAVAHVMADLRRHNIIPCLPLSEHLPFDMIAVMPDMATLVRLQVKYRESRDDGAVEVVFRSNYYDSKRIYSKAVNFDELDAYAVYIANTQQIGYFRVEELPEKASSITLRFEPPKNGQHKYVKPVETYINPLRIAANVGAVVPLAMRPVSVDDETAVARAALWLQEQGIRPHFPTSLYVPFDLVGVASDMKTIKRYRVGYNAVHYTPYADEFVVYDAQTDNLMCIHATEAVRDKRVLHAARL